MVQNIIPEDTSHFVARCRNCGATYYTMRPHDRTVSDTLADMRCTCGAQDFGVLTQQAQDSAQNNRPDLSDRV